MGTLASRASPTSQSVSGWSVSRGLAIGIVPDFSISLKIETKKQQAGNFIHVTQNKLKMVSVISKT